MFVLVIIVSFNPKTNPFTLNQSKMKTTISLTVLLFAALNAPCLLAQNQITGQLLDTDGQPLPAANVLLLAAADSSLVRGSLTDGSGSARTRLDRLLQPVTLQVRDRRSQALFV